MLLLVCRGRTVFLALGRCDPVDRQGLATIRDSTVEASTRLGLDVLVVGELALHQGGLDEYHLLGAVQRATEGAVNDGNIAGNVAHDRAAGQHRQFMRLDLAIDSPFYAQHAGD